MEKYKHKQTGVIGETNDKDMFLHFERGDGNVVAIESISMDFVRNSDDWVLLEEEKLPTKWFEVKQISTWLGESLATEGKRIKDLNGGHGKLIVMHQCGGDKESLVGQLKTMIYNIENGDEEFAC